MNPLLTQSNSVKSLFLGPLAVIPGILVGVLIIWSLAWKGLSLWRSSRHEQRGWFIVLFISSTVGILPIIYLVFFQKGKRGKKGDKK